MAFENGVNWRPLEPSKRGRHSTFSSALDAALKDLTTERNAFFDSLADEWKRVFPSLPARPGRYEDGKIVLYVKNPPTLYMMRMKLGMIKRKLAELPGAPPNVNLKLEVHSDAAGVRPFASALAGCAAVFLALGADGAAFTRSLERVTTMDPALGQSIYDARASRLVYKSVLGVDYEARPYALAPCACELPQVSPDGLVYRFRVRDPELAAEDVVRSLERLRSPDVVSPNGWMMKGVKSMAAVDERTVEIRLEARRHYFPWLMAMPSAAVMKADGSGTGPFELVKWWKNHEMVFRRRTPCPGRFDTVRFLVVDDVSTQWLMFLKGEMDFLGEISRDNWDAVIGLDGKLDPSLVAQGVQLHSIPTMDSMYIGFNMRDPVVGPNRKLRQALNAAFDYPAWERFYSGRIIQADGPLPPGIDGRLETPFEYAFDIEKARRLVAEAGYPGGIDPATGRRLVLTLTIGRASQDSREAGELMAAFYEKIGVKLELAFQTWDAFLKSVNEGRVQLFRIGWVGDYPDAQNFLQLFHSKNKSPGPNHTDYSNPEFDAEYDLALAASTVEERNRHWLRCQEIVREDCPWVFTHFNKSNSLVRPTVGNYVPSVFSYGYEEYYEAKEAK